MQYSVLGSDGKEYGPVDLPTLRQWAQEGRVYPTSQVRDHVSNRMTVASQMPELSFATPNSVAAPPSYTQYPRAGTVPQPMASQGSALNTILVRVGIAVVIAIIFPTGGVITSGYSLYYGIRAFLNKDPKGGLCLAISATAFAAILIWTMIKAANRLSPTGAF